MQILTAIDNYVVSRHLIDQFIFVFVIQISFMQMELVQSRIGHSSGLDKKRLVPIVISLK